MESPDLIVDVPLATAHALNCPACPPSSVSDGAPQTYPASTLEGSKTRPQPSLLRRKDVSRPDLNRGHVELLRVVPLQRIQGFTPRSPGCVLDRLHHEGSRASC